MASRRSVQSGRRYPGPAWHVIGSGDFNGDGKSDILWQHDSGQVSIWLMDGLTPLGAASLERIPTHRGTSGARRLQWRRQSDILWQPKWPGVDLADGQLHAARRKSGWKQSRPAWQVKGVGDFNGDGMADILWQNTNGQVSIWTMNDSLRWAAGSSAQSRILLARSSQAAAELTLPWPNKPEQINA